MLATHLGEDDDAEGKDRVGRLISMVNSIQFQEISLGIGERHKQAQGMSGIVQHYIIRWGLMRRLREKG